MWWDYGNNHRHTFINVWYRHSSYDILTKHSFNYHLRSTYVNANQLSHPTTHNCMHLLFIVKLFSFHGNTLLVFMLSCRYRQRTEFGENCYGNEPCFVPRNNNDGSSHAVAEDDGYLVCFVHNEATGVSQLLVMDALSPSLEVIAAVQLPSRVPYGFHGWFVNEQQLAKQA